MENEPTQEVTPVETTDTSDQLAARIAELEQERDNYKQMGLKYKNRLKEAGLEDSDEMVASLNEHIAQLSSQLELVQQENAELKVARLPKNKTMPVGSGGSEPEPTTPQKYTEDQLSVFKRIGITPEEYERTQKMRNGVIED